MRTVRSTVDQSARAVKAAMILDKDMLAYLMAGYRSDSDHTNRRLGSMVAVLRSACQLWIDVKLESTVLPTRVNPQFISDKGRYV